MPQIVIMHIYILYYILYYIYIYYYIYYYIYMCVCVCVCELYVCELYVCELYVCDMCRFVYTILLYIITCHACINPSNSLVVLA